MAKAGNHGQIIPRDKALLQRLYWDENGTLTEVGRRFGVNHKSVLSVFRALGIPTRRKGEKLTRGCIECGKPVYKIRHAGNGAEYGRRCKKHWNEHRAALAKEERERPHVKARRDEYMRRWYVQGAINPQGEDQWLTKGKALLRTARRALKKRTTPAVSPSRNGASKPERNSLA